jgi:Lipopolysaccharide kinase (Kdo/WaaP) family
MPVMADYQQRRAGNWRLTVLARDWNQELQEKILALVDRQTASKHPQTFELASGGDHEGEPRYLKVFHPPPGIDILKNLLRESKAARFLHQGLALSKAGFHAPIVIAVGETRRSPFSPRAFVLTMGVDGQSLVSYLHDCWSGRRPRPALAEKRKALKRLAEVIRNFHDLGFVHGDLVPSNLFVWDVPGGGLEFCFMDNDRTRHYRPWLPQSLWKRNLVQLNRFPLPGISLQDRLRFFLAYSGRRTCGARERNLLRWLELRTRSRRRECDHAGGTGSFRMLMRWTPAIMRAEQMVDPPKMFKE